MFPSKNHYLIEYSHIKNGSEKIEREVIDEGKGLKIEIEKLKSIKEGFKLIDIKSLMRES